VVERSNSLASEIELNYAKRRYCSPIRQSVLESTLITIARPWRVRSPVQAITLSAASLSSTTISSHLASNWWAAAPGSGILRIPLVRDSSPIETMFLNIGVDLRLVEFQNPGSREDGFTVRSRSSDMKNEGDLGAGRSRKILSLTGGGSAIEPVQAGVPRPH